MLANGSGVSWDLTLQRETPWEETPATLSPARACPKLPPSQRPSFLSRLHPKIRHPSGLLETPEAGADPGMAPVSRAPLPFLISPPTHHQPLFLPWQVHTPDHSHLSPPQVPHLVPLSCHSLQDPRGSLLRGAVRGPQELSPISIQPLLTHSSPLLLPWLGQALLPLPPPECVRGFDLPVMGSSPAQGAGRSFPRLWDSQEPLHQAVGAPGDGLGCAGSVQLPSSSGAKVNRAVSLWPSLTDPTRIWAESK